LEKCKGKETKEEGLTEKIIVIDDPISSLSHIYIFNVAQLIKEFFFEDGCKQVFILTHNLYFFHELVTIGPKEKDSRFKFDGNLFRISRKDKTSITTLKQDEIQNDYQAYWQIIKDHDNGNASDALLANSMRNILEYFFGFVSKESLNNAMQRIDKDGNYAFFIRYMSRESHSDTVNISDMKEIDSHFKEAFKQIFEDSGYIQHYNK
jgi:wobble nucleotide-excising tRNase